MLIIDLLENDGALSYLIASLFGLSLSAILTIPLSRVAPSLLRFSL